MRHEISLVAVLILILLADIFSSENGKKTLPLIAIGAFLLHTLYGFYLSGSCGDSISESFCGMFLTSHIHLCVNIFLYLRNILSTRLS